MPVTEVVAHATRFPPTLCLMKPVKSKAASNSFRLERLFVPFVGSLTRTVRRLSPLLVV